MSDKDKITPTDAENGSMDAPKTKARNLLI